MQGEGMTGKIMVAVMAAALLLAAVVGLVPVLSAAF